ncbi:centrosome-associated protein 350-like isoform X2 [Corticium candelabrum]|uniref:centrosome-associated protein 350-like isoform X2 n=1 Tax=Corticium candelabrum TaxID=121492 RepID=UPI002E2604A2|nr:centrosome-associated protein 350-like isoform X2 [Corticium candelabrum]
MANRGGNEYECRVARRVSDKMPVRRAHLSPQTNYSVRMAELAKIWSQFGDLKESIRKAELRLSPNAEVVELDQLSLSDSSHSGQMSLLAPATVNASSSGVPARLTLHDLSHSQNVQHPQQRGESEENPVKAATQRHANEKAIFIGGNTGDSHQTREERRPMIVPATGNFADDGKARKRIVAKKSSRGEKRTHLLGRPDKLVGGARGTLTGERGKDSVDKKFLPLNQLTSHTSPHKMETNNKLAQVRDVVKRQRESPSSTGRRLIKLRPNIADREHTKTTGQSLMTRSHHKEEDPIVVAQVPDSVAESDFHSPRKRKIAAAPGAPSYKGFNTAQTRFKTSLASVDTRTTLSHDSSAIESGRLVKGRVVNDVQSIVRTRDNELRQYSKASTDKRKVPIRKTHSGNEGKPKRQHLITASSWRQGQAIRSRVLGEVRKQKKMENEDGDHLPPTRDSEMETRDNEDLHMVDNVPVELSQHSIETLTEESEIHENGDSVHDIKANNLSSNVATLLAELQASETNDREEDTGKKVETKPYIIKRKREIRSDGAFTHAVSTSNHSVYPTEKVRHYNAGEVKHYMVKKMAARRQKEREEKMAKERQQEEKQRRLQQLYDYQRRHVAACLPKHKRLKMNETFSRKMASDVYVHEDSDKENSDMSVEWQGGRRTVTSLVRESGRTQKNYLAREGAMLHAADDRTSGAVELEHDEHDKFIIPALKEEENNEQTETPATSPQQLVTNDLPEVLQVDLSESDRETEAAMRHPTTASSSMERQTPLIQSLHESALLLSERIKQETMKLTEAGVLATSDRGTTSLSQKHPTQQSITERVFETSDLPGVSRLDGLHHLYEWQNAKLIQDNQTTDRHVTTGTVSERDKERVVSSQGVSHSLVAKRDEISQISEIRDGDSSSSMSTQSLIEAGIGMRYSSGSNRAVNQPLTSSQVQGPYRSPKQTGVLPWQQHKGDRYSVINIFTRRQTENASARQTSNEMWKYEDDFSEYVTESAGLVEERRDDNEMRNESESDIGSTHSLIQDETTEILREPEKAQEEGMTGQGEETSVISSRSSFTSESDEQNTLLIDQDHMETSSDVSPQVHVSDHTKGIEPRAEPENSRITADKPVDGSGTDRRFSPGALGRQFATELHLLESIDESMHQLSSLERVHSVSLAQQETVSVSRLLKGRQEQHKQEMESLAQKVKKEMAAVERQFINEQSAIRESLHQSRKEMTSARKSAEEAVQAATKSQTEVLQQVADMKKELDLIHTTAVASSTQAQRSVPSGSLNDVSTVTAAVTAAVDSVMKGRFDHFVKQQEQATMTSDQDHSMMSSASEITTSGSLHTASLTIGNGQSEEGDSSVLDDVVPVTSSDKGLSVQSKYTTEHDQSSASQRGFESSATMSHTAAKDYTSLSSALPDRTKEVTVELSNESGNLVSGRTSVHSQGHCVSTVNIDLTTKSLVNSKEEKGTGTREEGTPTVTYSMQFEDSEVTATAEESKPESNGVVDQQSFRLLLPSESHRRRQKESAMAALKALPLTSPTDSQDDTTVPGHDSMSPFGAGDSFDFFTAKMAQQLLQDEEMRAQHQSALLRLREKALREKAKAELAWLKHKEQRLRDKGEDDKMPPLEKRRRDILTKLRSDGAEIKRLRAANKAASHERKLLMFQQREISKMHETTKFYLGRLKRESPEKAHRLSDISLGESPKSSIPGGEEPSETDHEVSEMVDMETGSVTIAGDSNLKQDTPHSKVISNSQDKLQNAVPVTVVSHSPAHSASRTVSTVSSVPEEIATNNESQISVKQRSNVVVSDSQPTTLMTPKGREQLSNGRPTSLSTEHASLTSLGILPVHSLHSLSMVDSDYHQQVSLTQSPTGQITTAQGDSSPLSVMSPSSSDNGVMKGLRRLEAQSSERYLTRREQKLKKRRQQTERILKSRRELLEWQKRLDEEEAELQKMVEEAMGMKIKKSQPRDINGKKQIHVKDGHPSPGSVSTRSRGFYSTSDADVVEECEESSTATVIDEASVGTDYGSETFESLDKTATSQSNSAAQTVTLMTHTDIAPTATDRESQTETSHKKTSDIEKRITLLKEELSRRKAEAKRLREEKRLRKQALLEEQEARLKSALNTIEKQISRDKQELTKKPAALLPTEDSIAAVALSDQLKIREKAEVAANEQTVEQIHESMETPARHDLSTFSTFSETKRSGLSRLQSYDTLTFINSSVSYPRGSTQLGDQQDTETPNEDGIQDAVQDTHVALQEEQSSLSVAVDIGSVHDESVLSVPGDQHVTTAVSVIQEQQPSSLKTDTVDSFGGSLSSSTPKKLASTHVICDSLPDVDNVRVLSAEASYSDTFIPSVQSLGSVPSVRSEDAVKSTSQRQPVIDVSESDEELVTVEVDKTQSLGLQLEVGDRVLVGGNRAGLLQYLGTVHFASGVWAGVELDLPRGSHDGQYEGCRYFQCADHHGIFVANDNVQLLPVDQHDAAKEEQMIISLPNVKTSHSEDIIHTDTAAMDPTVEEQQSNKVQEEVVDLDEPVASLQESVSDDITPLADDDSELQRIISSAAEAVESFRRSLSPAISTDQDETSLGEFERPVTSALRQSLTPEIPTVEDSTQLEKGERAVTGEQLTMITGRQFEDEIDQMTRSVMDLLVSDSLNVMINVSKDKNSQQEAKSATTALHVTSVFRDALQHEDQNINLQYENVVNQLLVMLFGEAVADMKALVERKSEQKYYIVRHEDDYDTSLDNSSLSISSGISDHEPQILSPDYDTKFPAILIENREELQQASALVESEDIAFSIPFNKETVNHVVRTSLDKEEVVLSGDEHQVAFIELLNDAVQEVSQQLLPVKRDDENMERFMWKKPKRYHGAEIRRLKTSRQVSNHVGLMHLVEEELCSFLGLNATASDSQEYINNASKGRWTNIKTKTIEGILVEELRKEESQWIDYDEDETHVKFQLADGILDTLLQETAIVVQGVKNEKLARQDSSY